MRLPCGSRWDPTLDALRPSPESHQLTVEQLSGSQTRLRPADLSADGSRPGGDMLLRTLAQSRLPCQDLRKRELIISHPRVGKLR